MAAIRRSVAACTAVTLLSAGLSVIATSQAAAAETYWIAPTGNLTIFGKGFGHGRGMSQYGAQGAAIAGRTSTDILNFYYPGTVPATATGAIRVHLTADTTPGVKVVAVAGLRVRDRAANVAWTLPTATAYTHWELRPYGESWTQVYRYSTSAGWQPWRTLAGMAQFEGPPVIRLVLPDGSAPPYRGTLRSADRAGTDRDTINDLPLENYLRGVVPKEAISSWRPAALQAQAVAARTYAASKRSPTRDYDLCDTTACQVYGGYAAEVASTNDAVAATSTWIRTYSGKPILAEFSSSNGGYTTPGPVPYQVAKSDPYDGYPGNGNPHGNWTVSIDRATAEAKFGVGNIKSITITGRNGYGTWGGRVLSIDVHGYTVAKTFTGDQLRLLLGLKSTWIRFDYSAITKRWLAIGGSASPVGNPIGYEWPVRGGTGQWFASGHIYWSATNGAWEIYGGFETRYQQIGGPNHPIGIPIGPRFNGALPGSLVHPFRYGRMFYSAATSVREVYGKIYLAYYGTGLERGRLGLPRSYQYPVQFNATAKGAQQWFQGGYINWYATTNTTAVVYFS